MTATLRVLVLVDSLSFGGAEHLLGTFARHGPSAGLEMEIASVAARGPDSTGMESHIGADVSVSYLDIPRLLSPAAIPRVVAAIRESRCDVVHAHMLYAATLGPVAGTLARRPVVSTYHHVPAEPDNWRESLRERLSVWAASRGAAVIFVSDAARRAFAERYSESPRWRVVHNGIDLADFSPGEGALPDDLDDPGRPTVVMVAALRPPKGHADAIAAWSAVRRVIPRARLLVVGAGEAESRLLDLVGRLGLDDAVVFAGARTDVAQILRGSTLALSTSHTEALPTALIEAAACGVPVVATDVGGTSEVVIDGVTGVLVPPHAPDAVAAAVLALLTDGPRRAQMGAAGREFALSRFDAGRWVRTLRSCYDRAVNGVEAL